MEPEVSGFTSDLATLEFCCPITVPHDAMKSSLINKFEAVAYSQTLTQSSSVKQTSYLAKVVTEMLGTKDSLYASLGCVHKADMHTQYHCCV